MNDVTIPQFPWKEGDTVYASALNAAIANSAAYGPFLPLSGGTVTGCLTVDIPTAGANSATFKSTSNNAPGVLINPIGMYDPSPGNTTTVHSTFQALTNTAMNGGLGSDQVTNSGYFGLGIYGAPNNYCWALSAILNYNGTGGLGQHAAAIAYGTRMTAAAQPTTTVATTLGAPSNTLQIADVSKFQLAGNAVLPIVINGTPNTQLAVSGTTGAGTITLLNPVSVADGTAGHTVQGTNNPQIWGANIYAADVTGLDSQHTNNLIGIELDITADGSDNGGAVSHGVAAGLRSALSIVGVRHGASGAPATAEFGNAISITTGGNTTFKRGIWQSSPFTVSALDLRDATQQSGNAVWLGTGQTVALDTTATVTLCGDAQGGVVVKSPAATPARFILEPGAGSLHQWWVGAWLDNSFYVADNTTSANRIIISPAGAITLNGSLSITPLPFNAVNDAAAATGGVPVNGVYRNGSVLMIRTV
jgi:hypothetical protein